MTASKSIVQPGSSYPLGATWDGAGVNFALFSAHAHRVELCLFSPDGRREIDRIELPEHTDEIWHGYLPEARPGLQYGYRVHGPYDPQVGHRFNPHKLLLDPYARSLTGPLRWADAHFGYRVGSPRADLSMDRADNARSMPKSTVIDTAYSWNDDRPPNVPWADTIIYETHLRGFTMLHPAVPAPVRGTFAGLGSAPMVDYVKSLGITAIELLPIQAFFNDRHLLQKGLANYWGYNTIGFFAPEPRYLVNGSLADIKTAVARFHKAGIEVILDVVYNHTMEGNHMGPTLSFRGIDNASYYRLVPDQKRYYIDETGTGNTLNLSHPRVLQMVLDSLRYWVEEMHVDGFRFDLSSTLGREPTGFTQNSGFFDAVRQDPVLNRVKLIAEPWDVGPGGYQLGNHPPGWAEWNDRFRDDVRRFWRGDQAMLPGLAARLTGSADVFDRRGRRPWASVNFVAAHDGFTINDAVSYNEKHNDQNGEDGRDGHSENLSWNCGVEGPTDDPEILALRARQRRNLLATVLLAQGTPMILAGDEFARTQDGNNNAYCQDNELSWIDWPGIGPDGEALTDFVRRVIAIRRSHRVLGRPRYMHGEDRDNGLKTVTWVTATGEEKTAEQWRDGNARSIGMLLGGPGGPGGNTLLLIFNAYHDMVLFGLPDVLGGDGWSRILDTQDDGPTDPSERFPAGKAFAVAGRSVVVFSTTAPEPDDDEAAVEAAEDRPAMAPEPEPTPPAEAVSATETDPAAEADVPDHEREPRVPVADPS
ncbi:MAG: glycogen debranching protein GlgX [Inquilinaceae bacterium]